MYLNLTGHNVTCLTDDQYLTPVLRWIVPVLVLAGVVGNAFILIIFNSNGMRTKTNFILSAMAAADLAHAIVAMLINLYLYERLIDSDMFSRFYHHRMKPILMILVNWLAMTSTWLAVAATIERFIAIRYPLKAIFLIRKRAIVFTVCSITLISILICSYYAFWLRRVVIVCDGNRRLYKLTPDPRLMIYGHVARQIHSVLCSLIPISLLFYFNWSLVRCLHASRDPILKKFRTKSNRSSINGRRVTFLVREQHRKEYKIALVVITISITTAFLLTPSAAIVVYDAVRHGAWVIFDQPIITPRWLLPAQDTSNTFVLLEKVLDFFLYCLTSGSFRRRLMGVFVNGKMKRSSVSSQRRRVSLAAYHFGSTKKSEVKM